MPTKATNGKDLDLLRRQLTDGMRDPLADYRRFAMSGLDYKGQVQSGFGERGLGASLSGTFDFGTLIAPGLIHLTTSAALSGSLAHRTALVLHRLPASVRRTPLTALADARPPEWRTGVPISLMLLSGPTGKASATLGAGASLGVGDPYEADETGLAVGVKVEFGGVAEFSVLDDAHPAHYASAFDTTLASDVEWLLNQRIKQLAAVWLARAETDTGLRSRLSGFERHALTTADQYLQTAGTRWDDAKTVQTVPLGGQGGVEFGSANADVGHIVGGIFRWLASPWKPGTDKLLDRLRGMESVMDLLRRTERARLDGLSDAEKDRADARIAELTGDLATNRRMQELLIRRRKPPGTTERPVPAVVRSRPARPPDSFLHCGSVSGEITLTAGMKAAISLPELAQATVRLGVTVRAYGRTIWSRYQTHSAPPETGALRDRAFQTQSTMVHYKVLAFDTTATSSAGLGGARPRPSPAKGSRFGTATYRSVTASWLEPTLRTTNRVDVPLLPHGSGVSLGVSVTAERLTGYLRWCRTRQSELEASRRKLEDYLGTQLRVSHDVLRDFLSGAAVLEDLDPAVGVLVEASYEFTDPAAVLPVTADDGKLRAGDMFALPAVRERFMQKGPDPGKGNTGSRLQVLRLRFRRNDMLAQKLSLLTLGFSSKLDLRGTPLHNSTPWAKAIWTNEALYAEFAPSVHRTAAVGAEATFDFHVRYYGPLAAELNVVCNAVAAQELCVPPVALFNH